MVRPAESAIRTTMDQFRTTLTLVDKTDHQRRWSMRAAAGIAAMEQTIEADPNDSNRHRA